MVNPVRMLKIISRLNKLLVRSKSISTKGNVIVQVLAVIVYAISLFTDFIPSQEWKAVAVAVGALLQGVTGLLAHGSNPDGSNVTGEFKVEG